MVSFYSLIRMHMCVSNCQLFFRKNTKEVFLNLNVLTSWYLGPHYNIHAALYCSEFRKRADGNCIQIAAYRIYCSGVPWVRHISNSRLQRIVHGVEVQHLSPIRNTIHDIISVMGRFNLQYYLKHNWKTFFFHSASNIKTPQATFQSKTDSEVT